jgi:hypothetical protein
MTGRLPSSSTGSSGLVTLAGARSKRAPAALLIVGCFELQPPESLLDQNQQHSFNSSGFELGETVQRIRAPAAGNSQLVASAAYRTAKNVPPTSEMQVTV